MRTSIKIFLGSVGLLGIGLLVHDLQLNAAYRSGDYTKPFRDFATLNFRDFDRIQLNSGNALNLMLVQGDFSVMGDPDIMDWLDIRQEGRQLIITARFPYEYKGSGDNYELYISCPRLEEMRTKGQYFVKGVEIIDSNDRNPRYKPTLIKGFTVDSMAIEEENAGNLVMENDRINRLRAVVGGGSVLKIESTSEIGGGEMSVLNRSQLTLKDTSSKKLNYHIADGATLTLDGAAARQLLKKDQP